MLTKMDVFRNIWVLIIRGNDLEIIIDKVSEEALREWKEYHE